MKPAKPQRLEKPGKPTSSKKELRAAFRLNRCRLTDPSLLFGPLAISPTLPDDLGRKAPVPDVGCWLD
jgi:hypothetical protein